MIPFNHNLTEFGDGKVLVVGEGVRLPNQPAKFVLLSNWPVADSDDFTWPGSLSAVSGGGADRADAQAYQVFYGYGSPTLPLYWADLSPWLPVNNLNQIFLRCRKGDEIPIYYSFCG